MSARGGLPEGGRRRRARCAMPRGADALPIRRAFALGIVRALWRGGVIACERAMSVNVARLPTMLCVRSVRVTAPEGGSLRGLWYNN